MVQSNSDSSSIDIGPSKYTFLSHLNGRSSYGYLDVQIHCVKALIWAIEFCPNGRYVYLDAYKSTANMHLWTIRDYYLIKQNLRIARLVPKDGRLDCRPKYIGQNCFRYLFCMRQTNRLSEYLHQFGSLYFGWYLHRSS